MNLQSPWFEVGKHRCRISIVPGYDCRTECQHETKGNHGIHGDEWHFDLRTEMFALRLTCFTTRIYSLGHHWKPYDSKRMIEGAYLHLHDGRKPELKCDILAQGCANTPGACSYVIAGELFKPFARVVEPYITEKLSGEKLTEVGKKIEAMWPRMSDIMYHWIGN